MRFRKVRSTPERAIVRGIGQIDRLARISNAQLRIGLVKPTDYQIVSTSGSWTTYWQRYFPDGIPFGMLRLTVRFASFGSATSDLRVGFGTAGVYTNAYNATGTSWDYQVDFKWRHGITSTSADTLVIQSRQTAGGGSTLLYDPGDVLLADVIDGATTTGL